MEIHEKELKLMALELALEDLDRIIANMKANNYSTDEVNEYVKKRWNTWNEIYQVKKHEKNL
jgi:hypothetical protein